MKILLVEDDKSLQNIIVEALTKERFIVESASTYNDAIMKVEDYSYDCILLDVMLPDGNGLDLLDYIKKISKSENVIIISARDSIDDKVHGLEIGADDYLSKPFHIAELVARIRSVVRRKDNRGEMSIAFGNVIVYPDKFLVKINDEIVELNRKEYDILQYFLGRSNYLINKQTIAEAVWGDHIDQVDNFDFIYAQMKNLRKKMALAGANVEIKAVYGIGYKIVKI